MKNKRDGKICGTCIHCKAPNMEDSYCYINGDAPSDSTRVREWKVCDLWVGEKSFTFTRDDSRDIDIMTGIKRGDISDRFHLFLGMAFDRCFLYLDRNGLTPEDSLLEAITFIQLDWCTMDRKRDDINNESCVLMRRLSRPFMKEFAEYVDNPTDDTMKSLVDVIETMITKMQSKYK